MIRWSLLMVLVIVTRGFGLTSILDTGLTEKRCERIKAAINHAFFEEGIEDRYADCREES